MYNVECECVLKSMKIKSISSPIAFGESFSLIFSIIAKREWK